METACGPAYLPGFLSPIQSQPSLLFSAFPNQNMSSPRSAHAFLPGVTSTPRSSSATKNSHTAQQSAAKSKLKSGWRSMNSRKLHTLDLLFRLTISTSSYSARVWHCNRKTVTFIGWTTKWLRTGCLEHSLTPNNQTPIFRSCQTCNFYQQLKTSNGKGPITWF